MKHIPPEGCGIAIIQPYGCRAAYICTCGHAWPTETQARICMDSHTKAETPPTNEDR